MTQRIIELARMLGQTSEQEEELLTTLCTAAHTELAAALRKGVTPEDCPESFALAGAWLALAGLEVSRDAGQAESFSAGDVAVRKSSAKEKAKLLRTQSRQLIAAWTKDEHFLFHGV